MNDAMLCSLVNDPCVDSLVATPAHDGSVARGGAAVIKPGGDARDCVLARHSDDSCWFVLIRLRPVAQLALCVVSLYGWRATEGKTQGGNPKQTTTEGTRHRPGFSN